MAALLRDLGPATPLAELALKIGGHPNATRAHLDALVESGLAEAEPLPRSGPGRPALGWTLTDEGRRAVAGDPTVTAHAELVKVMTAHLAKSPDAEQLAREIGESWGLERVGRPSRAALLDVLTDLGFAPEEVEDGIRLNACPILDAAHEHPEVVCAIHAGLVAGASGSDHLKLVPFAERTACRIATA